MTLVLDSSKPEEVRNLLKSKLNSTTKSGNLSSHYGKLKRNLDGLTYQKEVRKDED